MKRNKNPLNAQTGEATPPPPPTQTIMWPTDSLVAHPQQAANFAIQLDEYFVTDIEEHGIERPIEILSEDNAVGLPGGTVVGGNRRLAAAKKLGLKMVPVVIRHDLRNADAVTVELALIRDNFHRRQLSVIDIITLIKRMLELTHSRDGKRPGIYDRSELRERIAKQFNMSPRNASRYLLIAQAPDAIREALRQDFITFAEAAKVAAVRKPGLTLISAALSRATTRSEAVAELDAFFGNNSPGRHCNPNDAVAAFARALQRGIADIADRLDQASAQVMANSGAIFEQAAKLLQQIQCRIDTHKNSN